MKQTETDPPVSYSIAYIMLSLVALVATGLTIIFCLVCLFSDRYRFESLAILGKLLVILGSVGVGMYGLIQARSWSAIYCSVLLGGAACFMLYAGGVSFLLSGVGGLPFGVGYFALAGLSGWLAYALVFRDATKDYLRAMNAKRKISTKKTDTQ